MSPPRAPFAHTQLSPAADPSHCPQRPTLRTPTLQQANPPRAPHHPPLHPLPYSPRLIAMTPPGLCPAAAPPTLPYPPQYRQRSRPPTLTLPPPADTRALSSPDHPWSPCMHSAATHVYDNSASPPADALGPPRRSSTERAPTPRAHCSDPPRTQPPHATPDARRHDEGPECMKTSPLSAVSPRRDMITPPNASRADATAHTSPSPGVTAPHHACGARATSGGVSLSLDVGTGQT